MKNKYLLILSLLFVSCVEERENYVSVCNCEQIKKVRDFVDTRSTLIDFEQLKVQLKEAETTGINIHCSKRNISYKINVITGDRRVLSKLDSCEVVYW